MKQGLTIHLINLMSNATLNLFIFFDFAVIEKESPTGWYDKIK